MPNNTKEYQKEYLKEHNVKVTCYICNAEYLKYNKSYHLKTQKHQKKIEQQNNNALQQNKAIQIFELLKKKIADQNDIIKQLTEKNI